MDTATADTRPTTADVTAGPLTQDEIRSMTGLEFLRAIVEGRHTSPAMGTTLGFRLAEVSKGRALFRGTPTAAHVNPMGTVHGGYAMTILDSALGCAIHSTCAAGTAYTTLDIHVNLVRAITPATGEIVAEGTVVHRGRRTATSEARLTDGDGKLLAHGTSTCMILDL